MPTSRIAAETPAKPGMKFSAARAGQVADLTSVLGGSTSTLLGHLQKGVPRERPEAEVNG